MSVDQRAALERLNHVNDARNCKADAVPVLFLEDGTEFVLPTVWGVCDVCDGVGSHVDPAIDAGGLSADDFRDDLDFEEDYRAGTYDVPCAKCRGRTTVRVVALDRLTDDQRKLYEQQLRGDAEYEAECRAEYLAGA